MIRFAWRTMLALLLLSWHLVSAADHGVGFHLSLDYGVASVYHSNGLTVNVANVAGGSDSRQLMRAAYISESQGANKTLPISPLNDEYEAPKGLLRLQSLRDYLPPWARDNLPSWAGDRNDQRQPLLPMLKALIAATESYLETSISDAEVVFPFPVSETFRNSLRSACSAVSLKMPNSALDPAGIYAARAHGIGNTHSRDNPDDASAQNDPGQLVLTVEYSRAALTALIVHEDSGVFEVRRVLHDTDLGLDQLQGGPESDFLKMEAAIKKLVTLPMDDGGNGEELAHINDLVLLGESGSNLQLQDVLKKVLLENHGLPADSHQRNVGVIDPLFAASTGVAFDCWDRLSFEENGM